MSSTLETPLSLPQLSVDAPILRKPDEFRAVAKQPGNDSFIRSVRATGIGFTSLTEFLYEADDQLDLAAQYCNAQVVKHTWKLKPRSKEDTDYYGQLVCPPDLLPEGHILVAQVDTIRDTKPARALTRSEQSKLRDGVRSYNKRLDNPNESCLSDICVGQFVGQETSGGTDIWLVDIEPRMSPRLQSSK